MKADREISQEEVNELIEDASYLQDEAEALQYVIDTIPYAESPPGGKSIAEMLLLIDHAQLSYYRPIIEDACENPRPTHLKNFTDFRESFEADEEKLKDVQKILRKISKHRAGLVNYISKVSLIDWETVIYENDKQILLYNFLGGMIRFERNILKDIADQVKAYKNDRQNQRELEKRKSQREGQQPANNS